MPQDASHYYYAISCPEPMHKFAWLINAKLSASFSEGETVKVNKVDFPVQRDRTVFLIRNRLSDGSTLIPTLKNVDYILKEAGGLTDSGRQKFVTELKRIDSVNAVILLDAKIVKGLNALNHLY